MIQEKSQNSKRQNSFTWISLAKGESWAKVWDEKNSEAKNFGSALNTTRNGVWRQQSERTNNLFFV